MPQKNHIRSPLSFKKQVQKYFEKCVENEEPVTYSGMIEAVGLTSEAQLNELADQSDKWADAVDYGKLLVAKSYEMCLKGRNSAGAIFALKQLGWSDKQELDHTSSDGALKNVHVDAEAVNALVDKLVD